MTQIMLRQNNDKFYNSESYSINKIKKKVNNDYLNTDDSYMSKKSKQTEVIKGILQNIDTLPFEFCMNVIQNHRYKKHKNDIWIPIKNTPFWSGGQSEVYILYKVFFKDQKLNIKWGIAKNFNDKENFKLENRMFNIIKKKSIENNSDIYQRYIPEKHGSIKTVINGKSKNFLVMEYLDAPTLSKLIIQKMLNTKLIIKIMIQLCEVISFFHKVGISHRDLKPQNIIVVRDRRTINGVRVYDNDSVQIKSSLIQHQTMDPSSFHQGRSKPTSLNSVVLNHDNF